MPLLLRTMVCAAVVLCATGARAQAEADMVGTSQRWLESAMVQVPPVNGQALRMEVSVGALDPRLQLAPCAKVEPYMPPGTRLWGKSRLGLRCLAGATRWNVFIPVTVKAMGRAWVAKTNVVAGSVLTAADAMEAEVDWADDASPVVANPEQWMGQVAARSWVAGQTVRQAMVKPAQVFQAGTQIRVLAQGTGFQVLSDGQAVTSGVVGQPAKVRLDSGRVMSGVVQDARTILVEM
ncbi:flagellar basal body P-ring formation chaperone FlgA [Rhodoferax sp. WC2427]|uniref:flagellar basal body P-ring formation chaperone FlgA n=1 Tax=Rhodoferax sp. WC2427 TaxID=3234144 RepID=UPI003466DE64